MQKLKLYLAGACRMQLRLACRDWQSLALIKSMHHHMQRLSSMPILDSIWMHSPHLPQQPCQCLLSRKVCTLLRLKIRLQQPLTGISVLRLPKAALQ